MLSPDGVYLDNLDEFYLRGSIPHAVQVIGYFLMGELRREIGVNQPAVQRQKLRIKVDRDSPLRWLRVHTLRIYINDDHSLWVGFETPEGSGTSFYWRPETEPPIGWVSVEFGFELLLYLGLLVMGIYRDLCLIGEEAFKQFETETLSQEMALYSWGSGQERRRIGEFLTRIDGDYAYMIDHRDQAALNEAVITNIYGREALSIQPKGLLYTSIIDRLIGISRS